jgi:two-component system, NtrC family, sensor histidine kinase KinB
LGLRLTTGFLPITTPREAARVVAAVAQQLIGWDRFSFCLYDASSNMCETRLSLVYQNGEIVESDGMLHSPLDQNLCQMVDDGILKAQPAAKASGNVATDGPQISQIVLPIQYNETVIGALGIESDRPQAYFRIHINTLQALVAHVSGAMQRIQAEIRIAEQRQYLQKLTQAVINSLSAHICVLDENGTIIAVNKAWQDYTRANGGDPNKTGVGSNYLDTCKPNPDQGRGFIYDLYQGLLSVMNGTSDLFETEYPCHSPDNQGWFIERITPLITDKPTVGPRRVVISHENITERKLAEIAVQQQNKQLSILYKTAVSLFDQLEANDLLQFAVKHASQLLETTFAAVMLRDGESLVVRAVTKTHFWRVGQRLQVNEAPFVWQVYQAQSPQTLDNYQASDAYVSSSADQMKARSVKATMGLPIMVGDNCLGVLVVSRSSITRPFANNCIQAGKLFAQLLSLSLENARLHMEMKVHLDELRVLYTAAQMTNRTLALAQVLEAAVTTLNFAGGFLVVHDDQNKPYVTSTHNLPTNIVTFLTSQAKIGGLCQPVARQTRPIVVSDLAQTNNEVVNPSMLSALQAASMETFVAIPLREQESHIGVLGLVNDANGKTAVPLKQTLLTAVGQQTAIAVANARLHQIVSEQHNRMATIIEASRDGILLIDMDRRIQVINQPALTLMGLDGTPNDWCGQSMRRILNQIGRLNADLKEQLIAEIKRVKTHDAPASFGKAELPPYIVEWHNLPVSHTQDTAIRLFILRDITEQEQAVRLRRDLTQAMVHDLRNPLTAISGAAELLALDWSDEMPDGPPPVMLSVIEQNSTKMMNLVNTIMDITQLETEKLSILLEPVTLKEIVAETFAAQQPLAQKQAITLENQVSDSLPAIDADRRLLTQTLQNLVDNALKFTPANGYVRVSAVVQPADHPMLLVTVEDNGPGIPDELLPQLFEKFVTGKHKNRGSGLGLAFCQLAIEAHGGQIWVDTNAASQGATFRFCLPISKKQPPSQHTNT